MQYRSQSDTIGVRTSARCDFGHSIGALSLVGELRF